MRSLLKTIFVFLIMVLPAIHAAPPLEGKLYYTGVDADGFYQIFSRDLGTGETQQLTFHENADSYTPRISPDGQRIFYVYADRDLYTRTYHIIDADGGNRAVLENTAIPDIGSRPAEWSPDSQYILFASYIAEEFRTEVYTMRSDGTGITRLEIDYAENSYVYATWTADSRLLVRLSDGIYLMARNGSHPQQVLAGEWGGTPVVFSPDYTQVAFQEDGEQRSINIIDLTFFTVKTISVPNNDYVWDLSWRGDYLLVFMMNSETGYLTNYLLDLQTYQWRWVGDSTLIADWSADGQYIIYEKYGMDEVFHVYAVRTDGTGLPIQLTPGYGAQATW